MKTSKFQTISVFLRVFVGLLLGFFMTSSVKRWVECTDGFLHIFDAVRNLQMQILALGVPEDLRFKCMRYGVVSTFLLARTLEIEAMTTGGKDKFAAMERMWAELTDGSGDEDEEISVHEKVLAM